MLIVKISLSVRNLRFVGRTPSCRLIDLLDQKEAMKVLDKYAPGITKPPGIFAMKSQTLIALADFPESNLTVEMVRALIEELNKIEWELVK
ncbi:hypothetical protein [Metabacillus sp. FJAT-53654]|uniref:Uncharacterized protein n=1 Tax=Metabacillus rhizosphaerae TaxID=3117747 RepID=A0ABZ2MS43_9BACI